MYKIIAYKIEIIKTNRGKKVYKRIINTYRFINKKDLSKKLIEIKKNLNDWDIQLEFVKMM